MNTLEGSSDPRRVEAGNALLSAQSQYHSEAQSTLQHLMYPHSNVLQPVAYEANATQERQGVLI